MMAPAGDGWTVPAQTVGLETLLLFLADIGIFRRTIMRWIYRRTIAGLILVVMGQPVWILLNGRQPVRLTSQDGDYV